jgi:hypothetical protein
MAYARGGGGNGEKWPKKTGVIWKELFLSVATFARVFSTEASDNIK